MLPPRDVGDRADHPDRSATIVPDGLASAVEPAVLAPLGPEPILVVIGSPLLEVGGDRCHRRLVVLGMEPELPGVLGVAELGTPMAEQLTVAGGVVGLAGDDVSVPDPVIGGVRGQGEPLLALAEGPLGTGDVGEL